MFTFRVGIQKLGKQCNVIRWFLQALTFFIFLLLLVVIILKLYNDPITGQNLLILFLCRMMTLKLQASVKVLQKFLFSSYKGIHSRCRVKAMLEGPCSKEKACPANHFSFYIQSGAANVVPPKICVNSDLVLGTVMNNAGIGINIVVINGKTGAVLKTDHFNMYSGKVEPLIDFLKNIETGSVVLMAVFDEGSTQLNEEARKLISDMGSSSIQSLGYRDNWVFVGGKGTMEKSNFEKYMKSNGSSNKYENWPEMVELEGCVPKYLE
ncbi:protein FAM3C-like [Anableps anableps]